jgi:hypothetical protein
LQAQFYEEKNSYGAKLTTILEGLSLRNDRKPDLGLNSELPVMSQIPSVHPQAPLEKT